MNETKFEDLLGKVLVEIKGKEGDDTLDFTASDGDKFSMYHSQDCCESVYIESIVGNLEDLLDTPILLAEEVTSDKNPEDAKKETIEYQDSFTWTFYKLSTIKGSVTIRWYGTSNGYYSESVDFVKLEGK